VLQEGKPLERGATPRSGGLLRVHHSEPADARLALASLPFFRDHAADCGYRRTGFALLVGPEHAATLATNTAMLTDLGADVRPLPVAEVAGLRPELDLTGVAAAAWEPDGGYVDVAGTCRALLAEAVAAGARLREGARVVGLEFRGSRVVGVRTVDGVEPAGTVVVAAGPWTGDLLGRCGVELPIVPRRIASAVARCAGPAPCTVIDDTTGLYFHPEDSGSVFFGVPTGKPPVAADAPEDPPAAPVVADTLTRLARRLPGVAGVPVPTGLSGTDGYTPDGHALIGPLPRLTGGWVAAGFSGGGAKTAPAVGAAIATAISTGTTPAELAPYAPDRFAAGRPVVSLNPYRNL
jgi:sarcosine oxidase, subunit beta